MTVFLVAVFALYFIPCRLNRLGGKSDFFSKENTAAIKGVFVLLVFASHFAQYVKLGGPADQFYMEFRRYMGQLVVVPFLVCSGYGIMASVMKRGESYVRAMPVRRILKVLFLFDLMVCLFIAAQAYRGNSYGLGKLALTFIGWDGIGNSNWYVFAILNLYFFSYLSFGAFDRIVDLRKRAWCGFWTLFVLAAIFVCIMSHHRPGYWHNTVFAYVGGVGLYLIRPAFDRIVAESGRTWLLLAAISAVLLVIFGDARSNIVAYQSWSVTFGLIVVLVAVRVSSRNLLLRYCGNHIFSLFILQRLPMMLLRDSVVAANRYAYLLTCLAATFVLSAVFDKIAPWLWNAIAASLSWSARRISFIMSHGE